MAEEDFDVDSLAAYLHLTPPQVEKLASRDKIPGRRVAGKWRFSGPEIHHWLEERIGLSDEEELAEMEDVLRRSAPAGEDETVSIAGMLPQEAIAVPLQARTRSRVITAMTELAAGTGLLWDPGKMAEAVEAREEMHPTATEGGVALLHPRRPMASILGEAFLALGITTTGIPFGGKHGQLTDIFFLICSLEDRGHLRVLARLSRLLGQSEFLEELRAAPDAQAAHQIVAEWDERIAD